MKRALLTRHDYSDHGTFGRITCEGISFFTGELPWRGNAPDFSCIPLGLYVCHWTRSPRFRRKMYEVVPVEKRVGIRMHPANFMADRSSPLRSQLNGCIALGERLGWMDGQKALLLSAPAMRAFEKFMDGKSFLLEVRNDCDPN